MATAAVLGFDDFPLEMQIKILKLVFIRPEARTLDLDEHLNVATHANLSAQLLRVCKVWHQYGIPLLLENVIKTPHVCTLFNMSKAGATKKFPQLLQLKHLNMTSELFRDNKKRLKRLAKFTELESIELSSFWTSGSRFVSETDKDGMKLATYIEHQKASALASFSERHKSFGKESKNPLHSCLKRVQCTVRAFYHTRKSYHPVEQVSNTP